MHGVTMGGSQAAPAGLCSALPASTEPQPRTPWTDKEVGQPAPMFPHLLILSLLLQGCSFTPRSCRKGMRCACLDWEKLYLFCHSYLCPSLYVWRKCQSEADRNIQTKEDTLGGFCKINVAKRRKWPFSPPISFLHWTLCTSLQEFSRKEETIGSQIRFYSPSKREIQPEVFVICSLKDCRCEVNLRLFFK